jgi:hypothetical protein
MQHRMAAIRCLISRDQVVLDRRPACISRFSFPAVICFVSREFEA